MKKLVTACTILSLSLGGALIGCGDPCEKTFKRWKKCLKKAAGEEGVKEADKNKDEFMKVCKKKKDTFKKCLDKDGCKEFDRCIESAAD
jgi:hypothetical protein